MALVIKGSSSGQVTVDVPAAAGTNTLTIPAVTGTLLTTNNFDLNGQELILDADGDTSIQADTDDQIDFRIGGSDKVVLASALSTFSNDLTVTEANANASTNLTVFNANGVATVGNKSTLHLGCTNSASHGASIIADFTGTANTNHATDLIFKTTTTGSTLTERMRIKADGTITKNGSTLGFGKILQVVNATVTGVNSTTGATYVASSIAAQITPRATSSKIIVMATGSAYISAANQQGSVTMYRDSTNLGNSQRGIIQFWNPAGNFQGNASMVLTDSPSSTSAVTYALYFRKLSTGGAAMYIGVDNTTQFMTLLEVEG